ncbi:MAG: hypothetical protein ABIR16_01035 [Dokdonella sp.]
MKHAISRFLTLALCVGSVAATASTTGRLTASICHQDTIMANGFEAELPRYIEASNGSGGTTGFGMRSVFVPGYGNKNYYRYVPSSYSPTQALPMILLLHGTGGPGTADNAAYLANFYWTAVANTAKIIVISAVGSSANGGWTVPPGIAISDYDVFRAMIADMKSAYNVDGSRIHGWGYSSGGSVLLDLVFGPYSTGINIDTFAGVSIWAGGLDGLACSSESACVQLVAAANRKIPVDLHVGINDTLSRPHVLADYSRLQNAAWVPGYDLWYRDTDNGHEYDPAVFPEIWDHLCPFQRLP